MSVDAVAELLRRYHFVYNDEAQLQQAIEDMLVVSEFAAVTRREVRLSPRDRIDFMVGRVGIEVKVAGKPSSVLAQLERYAESDDVDALVLVTSRARHAAGLWLNGKPVRVVSLLGAL